MRSSFAFVLSLLLAANAFGASSVWIGPFAEADDKQQPDWVTRSLQQSLTDELSTLKSINVQVTKQPVDATYTVRATVQRVEGELRVTGNVNDKDGKNVGGFKATGTQRDLFAIQDSVAQQVAKIVAPDEKLTTTEPVAKRPGLIELQTPFSPANFGGFEGSDLERAMRDGYVQRPYEPAVYSPPVYQEPMYPVQVGLNGNYYGNGYYGNPWGWGWGWGGGGNVVIIGKGGGNHCNPPVVNPTLPGNGGGGVVSGNGQAIRHVASWAGNAPSTFVNTAPGPQLVPGGAASSTGGLHRAPRGR